LFLPKGWEEADISSFKFDSRWHSFQVQRFFLYFALNPDPCEFLCVVVWTKKNSRQQTQNCPDPITKSLLNKSIKGYDTTICGLSLPDLLYNLKGKYMYIPWHNTVGQERRHPFDLHVLLPPWPPFTSSRSKERPAKSQFHPRSMKYHAYIHPESTILSPQFEVGWCWSLAVRHGMLGRK